MGAGSNSIAETITNVIFVLPGSRRTAKGYNGGIQNGGNTPPQLYELKWSIVTGDLQFLRTQWHVFDSLAEAQAYGFQEQSEQNGGLSPDEAALHGLYYKFMFAELVVQVDGYPVTITPPQNTANFQE